MKSCNDALQKTKSITRGIMAAQVHTVYTNLDKILSSLIKLLCAHLKQILS